MGSKTPLPIMCHFFTQNIKKESDNPPFFTESSFLSASTFYEKSQRLPHIFAFFFFFWPHCSLNKKEEKGSHFEMRDSTFINTDGYIDVSVIFKGNFCQFSNWKFGSVIRCQINEWCSKLSNHYTVQ